jgi:hypothetical protein
LGEFDLTLQTEKIPCPTMPINLKPQESFVWGVKVLKNTFTNIEEFLHKSAYLSNELYCVEKPSGALYLKSNYLSKVRFMRIYK